MRLSAGRFSEVCARWNEAVHDDCFKKFVLPVESGVRDRDRDGQRKEEAVRLRLRANTFACIRDALESARPGDVIVLSDGHYWEDSLRVKVAVRIIHDQYNVSVTGSGSRALGSAVDSDACSKCVVELQGQLVVEESARCAVLAGFSMRRSRRRTGAQSLIRVEAGHLSVSSLVFSSSLQRCRNEEDRTN